MAGAYTGQTGMTGNHGSRRAIEPAALVLAVKLKLRKVAYSMAQDGWVVAPAPRRELVERAGFGPGGRVRPLGAPLALAYVPPSFAGVPRAPYALLAVEDMRAIDTAPAVGLALAQALEALRTARPSAGAILLVRSPNGFVRYVA